MEAIRIENLSFRYPTGDSDALRSVSLSVCDGSFVTLCGASGSGKTTLLRLLKPSVSPHGEKSGEILFYRKSISELSHRDESEQIGFVFQSPENQLVTDKVWHELAFGLESLGLQSSVIRRRVAETAAFFGLEPLFERSVASLSGGQKQLLNLASVMVMQPKLLILDEPTSQLDPIAASELLACVRRINRELGVTVILTEHRLKEVLSVSDRVVVLENGAVIADETPDKIGAALQSRGSSYFDSLPAPMRVWHAVDGSGNCPVSVAQGRAWLESYAASHPLKHLPPEQLPPVQNMVLEVRNACFRYKKDAPDVLDNLSLALHRGELLTVLGGNGAGKTTMLSLLSGVQRPYRGSVKKAEGSVCAVLPQNPKLLLNRKTVSETLLDVFDSVQIAKEEQSRRFGEAVRICRLESLLNRHPFDLSGGEQQRAALAKLLMLAPNVLLLDEPTKGMDAGFKREFADILRSLLNSGASILMVSHDVEFCAEHAHRCAMLFHGAITAEDTPRAFFSDNTFYTTSACRMARNVIPQAVTSDDIIYCCTGTTPQKPTSAVSSGFHYPTVKPQPETKKKLPLWKKITAIFGTVLLIFGIALNTDLIPFAALSELPFWTKLLFLAVPVALLMLSLGIVTKRPLKKQTHQKLPKRTIAAAVMIFAAIPVTIFIGTAYLDDQKYLFISLLVLIECILPFFLIFEGRKPQPRELVLVAVLCAIAIAGRSAFAALPQVKPVIALVILSGVALGGETGFVVGAVTMLVSNIYFGQGAWTPWQMFAAGIIGFLSGVLSRRGWLSKNRSALCIYGFLATLLIYGLVMNFSTLILTRAPLNRATVLAYYAQGLPMDVIHALSTLAILFFAAEPMLEKLDRVKVKYGILYD